MSGGQSIQERKGCKDKMHNLETPHEKENMENYCAWEPESKKEIVEKNL